MDYTKNIKKFLEDFHKRDEKGIAYCARLGKLNFSLRQFEKMINLELKGQKRTSTLKKLHTRYLKIYGKEQWKLIEREKSNWNTNVVKRIFREEKPN